MSEENNEEKKAREELFKLNIDQKNDDINLNLTPQEPLFTNQEELIENNSEESEDEKEVLSDKDLKKLIEFTTGKKNITEEELLKIRENEDELERLIKISSIKMSFLKYNPKKKFGPAYKKQRQKRNRQANKSRAINRR